MIGVCIKYFHENYGGMLQAYATISILEKRGLNYELIQYKKKISLYVIIKSIPRLFNRVLLNDKYEGMLKQIGIKRHPDFAKNNMIRVNAFHKFENKHFTKLSPVYNGYNQLCEGAKRYSAVITGSDQLWSPAGLPTNYYNLKFVPNNTRKISYASSFGVSEIPWYQKRRTAAFLNRIEYISMREKRGGRIVRELTGRYVPIVIDPVLMFSNSEWEKLIPVKCEIREPYIFAYFLGNNPEYRKEIQDVAVKLRYKIVTLRHLDQYLEDDENFGDIALYDVDPERFLNLLRGASYVCTDSFHGACFSIICKKRFVIFNRYNDKSKLSKNSRIDTLCESLGLQDRRYSKKANLINKLKTNINYNEIDEKIQNFQKKANEYLDEALDGIT